MRTKDKIYIAILVLAWGVGVSLAAIAEEWGPYATRHRGGFWNQRPASASRPVSSAEISQSLYGNANYGRIGSSQEEQVYRYVPDPNNPLITDQL